MTSFQGLDKNFELNSRDSFRKVLHDLLSINDYKYNDEQAKKLFIYFHLFDTTLDLVVYNKGIDGLDKWKTKGLSMIEKVKLTDIKARRNEVVCIAQN